MNRRKKIVALGVTTMFMLMGIFCGESLQSNAMEKTCVAYDKKDDRCPCPMGGRGVLKESVNELKGSGVLTEDDVKNIDDHMTKDRESKEAQIKEKIYNMECEKIDQMVDQKVMTKEKGEKLKSSVKANLEEMKINMRK